MSKKPPPIGFSEQEIRMRHQQMDHQDRVAGGAFLGTAAAALMGVGALGYAQAPQMAQDLRALGAAMGKQAAQPLMPLQPANAPTTLGLDHMALAALEQFKKKWRTMQTPERRKINEQLDKVIESVGALQVTLARMEVPLMALDDQGCTIGENLQKVKGNAVHLQGIVFAPDEAKALEFLIVNAGMVNAAEAIHASLQEAEQTPQVKAFIKSMQPLYTLLGEIQLGVQSEIAHGQGL